MNRLIVHSACGLVAALAMVAVPAQAKAQYVSSGVGISVGSPGFGFSLGIGQPVYRPAPVVVPVYPGYPVYSSGYGVAVPAAPYWNPYRVGYPHGPYGHNHYNHSHYGHNHNGHGPHGYPNGRRY
jgi:hypothetical protein